MSLSLGIHSPKLDRVRALRTKAGRIEQGRFAVEGETMLAEARSAGWEPLELYATEAALATIASLDGRLAERTYRIDTKAMSRLSDLETPPGLIAIYPTRSAPLTALFERGLPIVVLAGISDPGNAGTLLRSADIFGFESVVFTADSVEAYNSKVVRATMGSIFRLSLATSDPTELLAAAAIARYRVVGTSRDGVPLPIYRFPTRSLIAIGNERRGVAASLPRVDESVAIPHVGGGESLNAAVAGSIIFYGFSQQVPSKIDGS